MGALKALEGFDDVLGLLSKELPPLTALGLGIDGGLLQDLSAPGISW
jgi:hypothetical protein